MKNDQRMILSGVRFFVLCHDDFTQANSTLHLEGSFYES
jgi:hypothetical protein